MMTDTHTGPWAGKPYQPSPAPTDPRIECRHHKAFVDCPVCNPRGQTQARPITHAYSAYGVRRCPTCADVLDGGPVQFRCESCRRTVFAADLSRETTRPLVAIGRAVA